MKKAFAAAIALVMCFAVAAEVIEPKTEKTFADTLATPDGEARCTGTSLRTKWLVKVYAVAHYGLEAAAPESEDPDARRAHWINADTGKAFVLKFAMEVDGQKMRDATAEAFDRVGFNGATREDFLEKMNVLYPDNGTLELIAGSGGKITARLQGEVLGSWEDKGLVSALWETWLGKDSVLNGPDDLVGGTD
jgi:hypothetical protein